MTSSLGVFGVVIGVSILEGLWTWLLAGAIAEVSGQTRPSIVFMALWLFIAWLSARILGLTPLRLERRRQIVVGGGLLCALIAGTIASGLVFPLQLIVGTVSPDYRGAGIALALAMVYLWGRGLALSSRVNRERALNHIAASAFGIVVTLLLLPLTDTVQRDGLPIVVVSFLVAMATLLLTQLAEAETRELTRLQWAGVSATSGIAAVIGGSIITGTLSSTALGMIGDVMHTVGTALTPAANVVFLVAGWGAQYLTYAFKALADFFHVDPEVIDRAVQGAQDQQLHVGQDGEYGPPEIMTAFVMIVCTLFLLAVVITIYYRVVYRRHDGDDQEVRELRDPVRGGGLLGALRDLFPGRSRDEEGDDADRRAAIRRHYRNFQTLLARAQHPRQPSQTAREFHEAVHALIPAVDPAAGQLTEAYLLARYAPPDAQMPDPTLVAAELAAVRAVLRSG
ncbi:MAG: hypothetical protein QOF51_3085 [Chloroflexota bacterium]|jgi:hypothetical protein|nr:hypothetical protein [Chloroflexota bacterium]